MMKQNLDNIDSKVNAYNLLREQKKALEAEMKKLSTEIQEFAVMNGAKDDKGSYFCDNGSYVFGKGIRKSIKLNEEKALNFVKQHKYTDCIEITESVNEDKLEELVSNGTVTAEDIMAISDEKVTYAIVVTKKDDVPDAQQTTVTTTAPTAPKKLFKKKV